MSKDKYSELRKWAHNPFNKDNSIGVADCSIYVRDLLDENDEMRKWIKGQAMIVEQLKRQITKKNVINESVNNETVEKCD